MPTEPQRHQRVVKGYQRKPKEYVSSIGEQLRAIRVEANFSQYDLAQATGINQRQISQYETGISEPPLWKLLAILNVCGGSADRVLGLAPHTTPHAATLRMGRQRKTAGHSRRSMLLTA